MSTAQTTETRAQGVNAQATPQERHQRIAEAAYFLAEKRNFSGGDALSDWLAAEQELGFATGPQQQEQDERAIYESLRQSVSKLLAEVKVANAQVLRQVFDRATAEIKKTGQHTATNVERIAASLRTEMADAAAAMGPKWEKFSDKSADVFSVWRDRGSRFLGEAASGVGEWLQQTSTKLEQQTYEAGTMVYRGAFACGACGERVVLESAARLPACPKCGEVKYRRTRADV